MNTHPTTQGGCVLLVGFVALMQSSLLLAQGGTWATKSEMPTAREASSACAIGGKIYVIGGADTGVGAIGANEAYEPATDSWTSLSPMPIASARATATVVDDKCYVIGGQSHVSPPTPAFDAVQVFDPAANSWSMRSPMPTALFGHAAAGLGGRIYVIGGKTTAAQDGTGLALVYDTDTDSWSETEPMPSWAALLTASSLGGRIYVFGGTIDPGAHWRDDVESFDPASETWTSKAPMPTARYGLTSSVVGQNVYVIGGARVSETVDTVEQYRPANNNWTSMSPAPTVRSYVSSAVVNGKIYVFGGTPNFPLPHPALDTVEAYSPPVFFEMTAGLNGNWWNGPARSGEGAQIEVADGGGGSLMLVATVYSYDLMGNQIFLVAVGTVNGGSAEVDVFITEGGAWGDNFDPSLVNETQWGTATFTASSCNSIFMELRPNNEFRGLGYTNLAHDLVRLTTPLVSCP